MRQPLLDGARLPSRIQGRAVLIRRLRGLLVATHRFGRGRARSRAELQFAARLIDGLTALLEQEGRFNAQDDPR